jgi:uncharacterized Zn finger protein (UPF0148 family)
MQRCPAFCFLGGECAVLEACAMMPFDLCPACGDALRQSRGDRLCPKHEQREAPAGAVEATR